MERMDISMIPGQDGGKDRKYRCHLCRKAFLRAEHMTRHLRTHTGEKPHACQFPGCTKKVARFDMLLRHSKIHNNPKSRGSYKTQQVLQRVVQNGRIEDNSMAQMISPPNKTMSRSVPTSTVGSPNISRPHAFTTCAAVPNNGSSLDLLAKAATQVEQVRSTIATHHPHHSSRHPTIATAFTPNFSHDSLSPTPDHTSLATPVHSPHLQLCGSGYDLPAIRNLSLQQAPALAPMEPQHAHGQYHASNQATSTSRLTSVISDIITNGSERMLPAPPAPVVMVARQQLVDEFMALGRSCRPYLPMGKLCNMASYNQGKPSTTGPCKAL